MFPSGFNIVSIDQLDDLCGDSHLKLYTRFKDYQCEINKAKDYSFTFLRKQKKSVPLKKSEFESLKTRRKFNYYYNTG